MGPNIVNKARKIVREQGIFGLMCRVPYFVKYDVVKPIHATYMDLFKYILPKRRNSILNEVELPSSIVRPRLYFDKYIPFYRIPDNPDKEGGIINAHIEYTDKEDSIVIIAGGMGVSTVRSAQVSKYGTLEVFEGGEKQADLVQEVVNLHDLDRRVNVHHAVVGKEIDVYGAGNTASAKRIAYDEIPDCDVLELDCEGSELEILRNLQITPRVIIVELHPFKAGSDISAIFDALDKMDYNITSRYSNQGQEINHEELLDILSKRKFGEVLPPVVVAIRN